MAPKSKAIRYALTTFERLRAHHADADCELVPRDPFQLLVAVVLSAQTTDAAVNRVLPDLFATMPDAASFATAQPEQVAEKIKTIGMYRQKAKHLVGLAKQIMEHHQGQVPRQFDALVQLPGVGRKTANVVMGVAFGIPSGVVVDTHVQRLSQRLGWTKQQQPESIEKELSAVFPKEVWIILSHVLIFHGRRVCTARAPACERCVVSDVCPSAGKAENVGRKPSRMRSLRE
ncbi:MAG TPA: endonuclease III [Polyangiaceae bacterium]|jgi:endonuclease-3|nr:MAG: Ultraviolet N-glycosylase/AP lyase [Deltaproteobacteria bacterium ADurb.Bin207]HNS97130.1 endonuclease III [Polyangiaceae bacterium]HNZ22789.1 endonuclease III [Polyangiaceae bacterium]HOD22854.1 endonuclease III [Polyangiaceae bacterium]HOE47687.1 endonuclease III [Polyangiaceae bacterium]